MANALTQAMVISTESRRARDHLRLRERGTYRADGSIVSSHIRVLIVESHPVFREGLKFIISAQADMSVVAEAHNSQEALVEFQTHQPDVTLIDQRLPGDADALIGIRKRFPSARVIVLATSEGHLVIQRALRSGAAGYLLKYTSQSEMLKTIRLVHRGHKHVPEEIAVRLAEHLNEEQLTPREIDVLKLIGEGNRNKQIAGLLSIAETTVNFHIKNLIDKLRAHDRTHAVTIAIRRGILEY